VAIRFEPDPGMACNMSKTHLVTSKE